MVQKESLEGLLNKKVLTEACKMFFQPGYMFKTLEGNRKEGYKGDINGVIAFEFSKTMLYFTTATTVIKYLL